MDEHIERMIYYMRGLTVVISANFMSLVSSHNKPSLAVFLVLEKFDIASSTLFPLAGIFIKLEEFGTPYTNTKLARAISKREDYAGIHTS